MCAEGVRRPSGLGALVRELAIQLPTSRRRFAPRADSVAELQPHVRCRRVSTHKGRSGTVDSTIQEVFMRYPRIVAVLAIQLCPLLLAQTDAAAEGEARQFVTDLVLNCVNT